MGIKPLELDPDNANVIYDTLINDAVGRNNNLWQFACFCSAQETSCSIALDSEWGMGKTFFLKQLQTLFDVYNDNIQKEAPIKQTIKNCFNIVHGNTQVLDEEKKKKIKETFTKIAKTSSGTMLSRHVCFYYDAWANDNAEDPIRSILFEIITRARLIKPFKKNNLWHLFLNKLCQFKWIRKHIYYCSADSMDLLETLFEAVDRIQPFVPTGAVVPFFDFFRRNNPVQEIETQKRFQDAFDNYLKSLMLDDNERLLVLIDELDRCKPTYAVQLLERIKHYLSSDRITFVFAINEEELLHTIKSFYGEDFNAYHYLDRFFTFRLSLPQPDLATFEKYYQFDTSDSQSFLYKEVCDAFVKTYPLSLRTEIKYRYFVKIVSDSIKKQDKFRNDHNWWLIVYVLVPFVLGLRFYKQSLYKEFIQGKNRELIRHVIVACPHVCQLVLTPEYILEFRNCSTPSNPDMTKVFKQFDRIYNNLFFGASIGLTPVSIPPFVFDKEMQETIFTASNMMADFIKYDTNTEETANG